MWTHPTVFDRIKKNVILFRPEVRIVMINDHCNTQPSVKVFPDLYNWTTYPLVSFLEVLYEGEQRVVQKKKYPNTLHVEVCSVAERALNYMHTGNTAVIATSVMNDLWIGTSIVTDGLPCFNPDIVKIVQNSQTSKLIVDPKKWPYDHVKHQPKSCSGRAQILTYDLNHFNVSNNQFKVSLELSSTINMHASTAQLIVSRVVSLENTHKYCAYFETFDWAHFFSKGVALGMPKTAGLLDILIARLYVSNAVRRLPNNIAPI
jgi:hypothetical protein